MNDADIRAFARLCHSAIAREFDEADFQILQRHASGLGQGEFALYFRQLKKIDSSRRAALADMYCENQIFSKLWLVEMLAAVFPEPPRRIRILGGWAGLQALLLRWLWAPEASIVSVDLDPEAVGCAKLLSEPFAEDGGLSFETEDLFRHLEKFPVRPDELLLCTITEHLERPEDLLRLVSAGNWIAVQGSSDPEPFDHVSAFATAESFRAKFPLATVLFEGKLEWRKSTRWMRIGQI